MTKIRKMILRTWMSDRGVTVMELMIAVVIAGILSALAIPRFSLEVERINFKSSSRDLLSNLREARSLSIAQRVPHGVFFNTSSGEYTLFQDKIISVPPAFDDGDSVLSVDTVPGNFAFVGSSFINNVVIFQNNGSASESGMIYCVAMNDGGSTNVAMFDLLASTGSSHISYLESY
ncbi:MAG: prepilin-type N-terminal cleavage/methylation domain-containing protein [candidate division Zixibacteria bacterium]|nr:prepilin-type N-terminal cleavage/methylation domain-containing protein [candidate division Zixibacteria bacterium]